MQRMSALLAIAAATSLSSQAIAAEVDCISKQELGDLGVALLPAAMEQAVSQCEQFLPAQSSLLIGGPIAVARYRAEAEGVREQAGRTIKAFIGDAMPSALSADVVLPFAEALMVDGMAGELDAKSCATFNNVWSPLASLPARNVINVAVAIFAAIEEDEGKGGNKSGATEGDDGNPLAGMKVCPFVDKTVSD
ncbi:MAG: hypothetical protein V3V15_07485 [Sphingorhabdus sp.]